MGPPKLRPCRKIVGLPTRGWDRKIHSFDSGFLPERTPANRCRVLARVLDQRLGLLKGSGPTEGDVCQIKQLILFYHTKEERCVAPNASLGVRNHTKQKFTHLVFFSVI